MPDEYGFPTEEEYARQAAQAREQELKSSRRQGASRGAAAGAAIGSFIAPGAGTAIGAGVGATAGAIMGGRSARGKGIWAQDPSADRMKEARIQAALAELEDGNILSDAERAEIEQRYRTPTVAMQRANQQMALQAAAGMDASSGSMFRRQLAADAMAADQELLLQQAVREAAAEEERRQREELLRLVEGEQERFEDIEDELADRTDEMFAQFLSTMEEVGEIRGTAEAQDKRIESTNKATGLDQTPAEAASTVGHIEYNASKYSGN
jgi:hypothetical protein